MIDEPEYIRREIERLKREIAEDRGGTGYTVIRHVPSFGRTIRTSEGQRELVAKKDNAFLASLGVEPVKFDAEGRIIDNG